MNIPFLLLNRSGRRHKTEAISETEFTLNNKHLIRDILKTLIRCIPLSFKCSIKGSGPNFIFAANCFYF